MNTAKYDTPADSGRCVSPMINIVPGERLVWHARLVEIDGAVSATHVSVRDLVTGHTQEAPIGELRPLEHDQSESIDLTKIAEKDWKSAKERAQVLQPLARCGRVPSPERRRIAARLGISERQLRRVLSKYRNAPRVLTLVKHKPGPRAGSSHLTLKQEKAIAEVLRLFYDQSTPKKVPDLMDNLAARCQRLGCPTPSESTVRRRIKAIEEDRAFARREARAATRQRHDARMGYHEVKGPLQWVQIDHTPLDVMVVSDDRFRVSLGRPWFTCAIDVRTRCILGFYLSLDRPAAESVAGCLAQAMLPKDEWLARIGLDGAEWPMYGTPKVLHADNAWEFDSLALRRGCDYYNIDPRHRPKGTPHHGGHIERHLGTFAGRVHALPGTTFSNPIERDNYKSEAHAVKTLIETRDWLVYEIMRYHSTEHRGLRKETPRHAWIKAFTRDGRYCPPPVPTAGEALLLQFLPCVLRKVHREGVYFDTLTYVPADPQFDMSPYVGRSDFTEIYIDRRDISFIYLRTDDGKWIALRPNDPDFRPVSRTEFKRQRQLEYETARDPNDLMRRVIAVEAQERQVHRSRSATRAAHRREQQEASRLDLASRSRLPRTPPVSKPTEEVFDFDPDEIPTPNVEHWD